MNGELTHYVSKRTAKIRSIALSTVLSASLILGVLPHVSLAANTAADQSSSAQSSTIRPSIPGGAGQFVPKPVAELPQEPPVTTPQEPPVTNPAAPVLLDVTPADKAVLFTEGDNLKVRVEGIAQDTDLTGVRVSVQRNLDTQRAAARIQTTAAGTTAGYFMRTFTLPLGKHSVTVTATDREGNVTSVTNTFTIAQANTEKPLITIVTPAEDARIVGERIDVAGYVDDAEHFIESVDVRLDTPIPNAKNALSTQEAREYDFFQDFPNVAPGMHTIYVAAWDELGHRGDATRTIEILPAEEEAPAPTVTITSEHLKPVNEAEQTITGTVNAATTSLTYTVNAEDTKIPVTVAADGSFSAPVTLLTEGVNGFFFTATNAQGKTATATVNIKWDTKKPVVVIKEPVDGQVYHGYGEVPIRGHVEEDNLDKVVWAKNIIYLPQALLLDDEGFIALDNTIPIIAGENKVRFWHNDDAGNTSDVIERTFYVYPEDTAAPVISGLPEDQLINTDTFEFTAKVEEQHLKSLIVNGVEMKDSVAADGTFTAKVPVKEEGKNTIKLIAEDAFGGQAVEYITITRDTTLPVVDLGYPKADAVYYNSTDVPVTGQVLDDHPEISVMIANRGGRFVVSADKKGKFLPDQNIRVLPGENFLEYWGFDTAGNIGKIQTRTITVIADDTKPAFSGLPATGTTIQGDTLEFTARITAQNLDKFTINGEDMTKSVGPDGSFTVRMPLKPNRNVINLYAYDTEGHLTYAMFQVISEQ
jgi:uncharacterized protein YfaP (DUF2135 family)